MEQYHNCNIPMLHKCGRTSRAPKDDKRCKKLGFEYVIVYKLDCFAHNRYDSAIYKHKLKSCGVRLISATENISDNPKGIILEIVPKYFSAKIL